MVDKNPPIDQDLLLAQAGWVRSLARSLVHDPSGAEDLEQETWLAALKAPPSVNDPKSLRAWLGRVAYNLSNLSTRSNARRKAREERAARGESTHRSVFDTVERASTLRMLMGAVMALDEPFRSCILLRYFEGLSTVAIAEETGASAVAVRKRLSRARELLREKLDDEHDGDRSAWLAALLPLALPPAEALVGAGTAKALAARGTDLHALTSGPVLWGTLLTAGLLAGAALLREPAVDGRASSRHEAPDVSVADLGERLRAGERESLAAPFVRVTAEAPPALDSRSEVTENTERPGGVEPREDEGGAEEVARFTVTGQVVDAHGAGWPGLTVSSPAWPGEPLGVTGRTGHFRLELEHLDVLLRAEGEGVSTLRGARVTELNAGLDQYLVAARAVDVRGTVTGPSGERLAGAELRLEVSEAAFVDLTIPLERGSSLPRRTTTDGGGAFALTDLISLPGAALVARLDGYEEAVVAVPAHSTDDLSIELRPLAPPIMVLAGVVRIDGDQVAAGAEVRLGRHKTTTDDAGRFELPIAPVPDGTDLVAVLPGFKPSRLAGFGALTHDPEDLPWTVEMMLGMPTVQLAGLVLDTVGRPAQGWHVYAVAEAAGARTFRLEQGAPQVLSPEAQEALIEEGTLALTDEAGTFHLKGLAQDTDYELLVCDPHSLATTRFRNIAWSDDELVLHVPQAPLRPWVAGTLVQADGAPLQNARVTLTAPITTDGGTLHVPGESLFTDPDGGFEFAGAPPEFGVRVEDEYGNVTFHILDAEAAAEGLLLDQPATAHLKVEVPEELGDEFAVVGEDDEEQTMRGVQGASRRGKLFAGTSTVQAVRAGTGTLVVYAEGVEVLRRPVELPAGELTSIGH